MIIQKRINMVLGLLALFVALVLGVYWYTLPSELLTVKAAVSTNSNIILFFLAISLFAAIAFANYMLSFIVITPLNKLSQSLKLFTKGDFDVNLKEINRDDEVGDIARAVHALKEHSIKLKKMEEDAIAGRQKEKKRNEFLTSVVNTFKSDTSRLLNSSENEYRDGIEGLKRDFHRAIDRLMQGIDKDMINRRESVRFDTDEEVSVEIGPDFFKTSLVDKSETGLKMLVVDNLVVGEDVIIHFENSPNKIAKCMWKNEEFAGFKFMVSTEILKAA